MGVIRPPAHRSEQCCKCRRTTSDPIRSVVGAIPGRKRGWIHDDCVPNLVGAADEKTER